MCFDSEKLMDLAATGLIASAAGFSWAVADVLTVTGMGADVVGCGVAAEEAAVTGASGGGGKGCTTVFASPTQTIGTVMSVG